jgi:kinesin family protein 6/9
VLKDTLGGNSKTVVIANICPEERFLEETLSTLQFAARVKSAENQMKVGLKEDREGKRRRLVT